MSFSPDGKLLATVFTDNLIKIWNTAEKKEEFTLSGNSEWISSVSFSQNGKFLANGDKTIKIWNLIEKKRRMHSYRP